MKGLWANNWQLNSYWRRFDLFSITFAACPWVDLPTLLSISSRSKLYQLGCFENNSFRKAPAFNYLFLEKRWWLTPSLRHALGQPSDQPQIQDWDLPYFDRRKAQKNVYSSPVRGAFGKGIGDHWLLPIVGEGLEPLTPTPTQLNPVNNTLEVKGIAWKASSKFALTLIRDSLPTLIVMGEVVLQSNPAWRRKVFTFTERKEISVSASFPLRAIGFLFASGRQSGLAQLLGYLHGQGSNLKACALLASSLVKAESSH